VYLPSTHWITKRFYSNSKTINTTSPIRKKRKHSNARIEMKYKVVVGILFIALLLPFTILSCGENRQLRIIVINEKFEIIDEIEEGEEFIVYAVDVDDPSSYPLSNLTIVFNGKEYFISEDAPYPMCDLTAPQVSEDKDLRIIAKKDGYDDGYQTITILNIKRLRISPTTFSIEGDSTFKIKVTDEENNPISDAEVELTIPRVKTYKVVTDENGVAELNIPSVEEQTSAFIRVSKAGYESATIQGIIRSVTPPFPLIPFVLIVGIIIFVFIGIMKMERRRVLSKESKEVREGVRIEEITIGVPELRIEERPERIEKREEREKREEKGERIDTKPDAWLVGTNEIRAKIDKKIGGAPPSKIDVTKWFTGREEIIAKVDEKIRQYDKRKKQKSKEKIKTGKV
jgi:hypothetical protein